MAREAASLTDGIDTNTRNRTIDLLLDSVALHALERAVGIVFSGSLDDGSRGLAAIHAAGGVTMVLNLGRKPVGMQQHAIEYDGPHVYRKCVTNRRCRRRNRQASFRKSRTAFSAAAPPLVLT